MMSDNSTTKWARRWTVVCGLAAFIAALISVWADVVQIADFSERRPREEVGAETAAPSDAGEQPVSSKLPREHTVQDPAVNRLESGKGSDSLKDGPRKPTPAIEGQPAEQFSLREGDSRYVANGRIGLAPLFVKIGRRVEASLLITVGGKETPWPLAGASNRYIELKLEGNFWAVNVNAVDLEDKKIKMTVRRIP